MSSFDNLLYGFQVALEPTNLIFAFLGVLLGTIVGILPGIGPAMTVAILLPVTFQLDPTAAFIMFAGIYYGGMYGGSTTSILLNTPGETGSMITALQGNLMAKNGRAAEALSTAAIGSFIAAFIGTTLLVFFAPRIAEMALLFGPAEYFSLITLGFVSVASVLGSDIRKGVLSLLFGLAVGLIGIDLQTGQPRFTFGLAFLLDGINVVVFVVGLFAIGESLYFLINQKQSPHTKNLFKWKWLSKDDVKRSSMPWFRGSFIGFFMGCLPAGGAEIPTFMSYGLEKKLSKRPEDFESGAIEGVAGPEAANNAAAAGVLVPLLTLGLPTSATAAIMLAAFQQFNIQPGPLVFINNAELVWGMIASLFIGNIMLVLLNLPLAPLWARILDTPKEYLYAGIFVFASLGVYSLSGSTVDLVMMIIFGVIGLAMRLESIPLAPAVIGVILGPLGEQQFRRALAIGQGDIFYILDRPLSLALLLAALLVLTLSIIFKSKYKD